jgi:hypothetical protein
MRAINYALFLRTAGEFEVNMNCLLRILYNFKWDAAAFNVCSFVPIAKILFILECVMRCVC